MSIGAALAMELNYEAESTRKYLELLPVEKLDWRPHPKSMTLGALASHIAEIPKWTAPTIGLDEFVLNMAEWKPFAARSVQELLTEHDRNNTDAAALMDGADDHRLTGIWKMRIGDKVVMELPRVAVLRTMIIKHVVHHRAQLGVYYRLNEIALPSVYGPTADAPGPMG